LKAMRTVVVDDELAALVEREQTLDQATREALVVRPLSDWMEYAHAKHGR